ncbi:MAG: hypothetical protein O2948_11340 [Proteobacteria bacterium]|nr:hypothetical protein [Pseudomonadota bacterium]MDA0927413.1 hypothetical protein [Pseudomonadota bacterium]
MKALHTLILVACGLVLSTSAMAASSKRIQQQIDAADLVHVDFEISIAEIDIEVYDGDSIELDLHIEADRDWWIFGRNDIDDVELQVDRNGEQLKLRLDDDDIEQEWVVRLPAHLAVSMDIGVGEVQFSDFANNLNMKLGVGSMQLNVAEGVDFESIHLKVGVGDTSVRGFDNGSDNERSFVGADSWYHGDGEFVIEVEVGVGDARVRRH